MPRMSEHHLCQAISKVGAMCLAQKAQLADEIFHAQPNLLGSVLAQQGLGVSLAKIDFLLNLLLVSFQAMKESRLTWPLITEAELERQVQRHTAIVSFGSSLEEDLRDQSMLQYVDEHPEKALLAYVQGELGNWLRRIEPEESDKYVMTAAMALINCIAFVPLVAVKGGK